jgi:hypothetical protein
MKTKVENWLLETFPDLTAFLGRFEKEERVKRAVLVCRKDGDFWWWASQSAKPLPVVVDRFFSNYPYPPFVSFEKEDEYSVFISRAMGVGFPFSVFKRGKCFLILQGRNPRLALLPVVHEFLSLVSLFFSVRGEAEDVGFLASEYLFSRVKPIVSSLVNYVEFLSLSEGGSTEEGLRFLLSKLRTVERLLHRCKLLEEYRRGLKRPKKEVFSLGSVFERLKHSFAKDIEVGGGTLQLFYTDEDRLSSDPEIFFYALYELVSWLVDTEPKVNLVLKRSRDRVVVEAELPKGRVFEEVLKDRRGELVLTAVKEFVRVLGGELIVESKKERGNFFFKIP